MEVSTSGGQATGKESDRPYAVCQGIFLRSFGPEDQSSENVRAFFRTVATELGWQPGGDLDTDSPYVAFSHYFALVTHDKEGEDAEPGETVCGGLHLVRGNRADLLPTRSVWPELNFGGRGEVADVFLLALAPSLRGYGARNLETDGATSTSLPLFWRLCVGMWTWCQVEGIHELCGIATPSVAALYRRLGWPLSLVGPERLHWGEPCVPFLLSLSAVHAEIARRAGRGSEQYRRVLEAAQKARQ